MYPHGAGRARGDISTSELPLYLADESGPERSRVVPQHELEGLAERRRGGGEGVKVHENGRVGGDHARGVAQQHREPLRHELSVLAASEITLARRGTGRAASVLKKILGVQNIMKSFVIRQT